MINDTTTNWAAEKKNVFFFYVINDITQFSSTHSVYTISSYIIKVLCFSTVYKLKYDKLNEIYEKINLPSENILNW